MSIKQSAAALFILLSVSFSAVADSKLIRINKAGNNSGVGGQCSGLGLGSVVSSDYSEDFGGKVVGTSRCQNAYVSGTTVYVKFLNHRGDPYTGYFYGDYTDQCPSGQVLNPENGKCEEPPYCSRESTKNEIDAARLECESTGKQFSYTCSN